MARYREKDEMDLRWNSMRRRLTRELDTQIADWRERVLNGILSHAFDEHVKAIGRGEVLEIEPDYEGWVARALEEAVAVPEVEHAPAHG